MGAPCNLGCLYCYLQSGSKKFNYKNDVFSKKTFDEFWKNFILKNKNIDEEIELSFWGGEPLLNFQVLKYIVKTFYNSNKKFKKIKTIIVTNGTILKPEMIKFYKKFDVKLMITLDGDKKCHDAQRMYRNGGGSYETILRNIQKLQKKQIDYRVRTTLTAKTPSIEKIVKDFKKNKLNGISLGIISPTTDYDKKELSPIDAIKNANDLFSCFKRDFQRGENFVYVNINKMVKEFFLIIPRTSCGLRHKIAVKYDGSFYPCHRMVDDNKHCVGNINVNIKQKLLSKYKEKTFLSNSSCRNCDFAGTYCGGFCSYEIAKHKNKNYIQKDFCLFQKTLRNLVFKFIINLYFKKPEKYHKLLDMVFGEDSRYVKVNKDKRENKIKKINLQTIFKKNKKAQCLDYVETGLLFCKDEKHFPNKIIANTATMFVWDLIDGKRSVSSIIKNVLENNQQGKVQTKNNVLKVLKTMENNFLIEKNNY